MDVDLRESLAQLGAELRFARIKAGLTQADISAAAAVSRQLVNRVENGHNGEISSYLAVAKALGLSLKVVAPPALNASERAAADLFGELQGPEGDP